MAKESPEEKLARELKREAIRKTGAISKKQADAAKEKIDKRTGADKRGGKK